MKRYVMWFGILLLAGTLVSCGGGGGGGGGSGGAAPTSGGTPGGTPPSGGGTPPSGGGTDTSTRLFQENDATFVTRSGDWGASDPHAGWSGGSDAQGGAALESSTKDASITFSFTGTSVRWIGARGRNGGKASVRVDGAEVKQVNLFARPNDEFRTPCFTIYDLTPGPHTLTIVVMGEADPDATGTKVWVDAFEVNPLVVSHLQESDPAVTLTPGVWAEAPSGLFWSGSGAGNTGEPLVGAIVTETKDATATLSDDARGLSVRGTSISWIGYRGPDGGIAEVSVDGGAPVKVDTYAAVFRVQEVLFTASGLEDKAHTLTIRATGDKNPASSAAKIFIDAFDVAKPGKRFEDDSSVTFTNVAGVPGSSWTPNNARVWSEGLARTNPHQGAAATFKFNGTSVSWIGCEKSTIGTARVFLDDEPPVDVSMNKPVGIPGILTNQDFAVQGFQRTVFRKDGLAKGPHTLRIEVTSNNNNFVVVDAFDVVE